jgi:putative hydrolase of the HAD superfamily
LLREAKLRIGVLSNFALASLEKSLEVSGLSPWIDVACAATVIGASKPDRAAYTIAAQRLGVAPEQCLFLDDEPPCVAGAAACGMHAYLVDRSLSAHDIVGHKVADLSALPALLSQFNLP